MKDLRPTILIAAYDVSNGSTSEGYVAFNLLRRLRCDYRIILVTRQNNRDSLFRDANVMRDLSGIRIMGFDLPSWVRWWKRGRRFYFLYAYIWQLCWPVALLRARRIRSKCSLCHVLNFHNDSIPSLAWILGVPVVWGPINHNEIAPPWRMAFWPWKTRLKSYLGFFLRMIAWRFDPLLSLHKRNARIIFSAGPWVDRRLRIHGDSRIIRLSQLGVDTEMFTRKNGGSFNPSGKMNGALIVHAGRMDWIKGLDIAIEALALLPSGYRLTLMGNGPAEDKLRQLVENKKLKDRVSFEPDVQRARLPETYKRASLFLFPSSEAGGLAWVEALSCGLPVVGFKTDSQLTLIQQDLPCIFLARSEKSREQNIRALASTIQLAIKEISNNNFACRNDLNEFSWQVFSNKISAGYKKLSDN